MAALLAVPKMPTISPGKTTNPIDSQAVSGDRTRRNWQRLARGGVNQLVQLNPTGDIVLTKLGLAVLLDPNGALADLTGNGIAVQVDGTSIEIVGDQLVATAGSLSNVMGLISIGI